MEAKVATEKLFDQISQLRDAQEHRVKAIELEIGEVESQIVHYEIESAAAAARKTAGILEYDPKPILETDEDEIDIKTFGTL